MAQQIVIYIGPRKHALREAAMAYAESRRDSFHEYRGTPYKGAAHVLREGLAIHADLLNQHRDLWVPQRKELLPNGGLKLAGGHWLPARFVLVTPKVGALERFTFDGLLGPGVSAAYVWKVEQFERFGSEAVPAWFGLAAEDRDQYIRRYVAEGVGA